MDFENINTGGIPQLFDLVQQSSACHLKYCILLKKALNKENGVEILMELCRWLQYAFLTNYKERNIYLERIISFTALFTASFTSAGKIGTVLVHPTFNHIFQFILKLSNSTNESHRYWSCKLYNKVLQELEEVSDELYEEITDSMLKRLNDPKAVIRCQAVIALHRLQDPTDKEDSIICHFCTLLNSDYNSKVRQLCLEKLALNNHVIQFVLNRIRDIDANVRLTAFQKLCPVSKYLKVSQRRLVLQCGFNDSSEKIRNFTYTVLLENWFENCDNDYLKLMESIRLDACEEDITATIHLVELVLRALFKSTSVTNIVQCVRVNDEKLIEYTDLNWESVLYYRIAIQFLRECDGFEDALNSILPELVYFCRYIKGYSEYVNESNNVDQLEYSFTLQQFFLITQGYDVSDTASRQCLNSLVHFMLQTDLSTDVAETVISNLVKSIPNVTNRSVFVCEIISYIAYGEEAIDYEQMEKRETERSHMVSQLQSDIISLQEEEKHCVFIEKNFTGAERIKNEIESKKSLLNSIRSVQDKPEQLEKKTDTRTMLRCLTIAEGLLRSPSIKVFNPAIATLTSEIINQALIHDDDAVKAKALKCYALCCVIDQRSARYGIHLFSGLIFANDVSDIPILVISIKTVVDILTIYGLSLIEKRDEEDSSDSRREEEKKVFVGGTSLTDLIQALADHLEHEDPQVQETATKGVCILLLHSRITSPSLLSRIIIKWANPATDDERLKQFIGLTLNALTALPNCYTYFGDAVITTIRTLIYAPKASALSDINIDNIIKFMVTLCHMPSQGPQIHSDLALKICIQMRDKPKVKVNLMFSKVLSLLTVPPNESLADLLTICDELKDVIRDSQILKNITKFIASLTKNNVDLVPIKEEDAIN